MIVLWVRLVPVTVAVMTVAAMFVAIVVVAVVPMTLVTLTRLPVLRLIGRHVRDEAAAGQGAVAMRHDAARHAG